MGGTHFLPQRFLLLTAAEVDVNAHMGSWLDENERYRILIDAITDYAIYMLDRDGHVASWNAGAERFKGYRSEEIIGQHFSRFYTPEDQAAQLPLRALTLATTEGRFENEGWRVRKDGSRFWAQVVIDPIRAADGELLGFAKVTRDLTERMEAQAALEHARDALFQSQKIEAIGQLTGGIAHDFNNLLMVVLNSMELLARRIPFDPRVTPLIENARQAALRGSSLTQRLLAFARRQELKLEAIDPAETVHGMLQLLQHSLDPRIQIRLDLASPLPFVKSDANQLETALLNLAVNARDAMPDGGTLLIRAHTMHLPSAPEQSLPVAEYVCITVADTGIGMDPATLSRAREPFFTTKGIGKGTGLGLSMVQGLIGQSGGELKIASTPGVGTQVTLWLPSTTEARSDADRFDHVAAEHGTRTSARVLLVDDDELVLVTAKAMLEDLGHVVCAVGSAAQALELLRRGETFDLVISDHAMPEMTGLQLAREVHAAWPRQPFVLATGYAEFARDDTRNLRTLMKPFNLAGLRALVAEVRGG